MAMNVGPTPIWVPIVIALSILGAFFADPGIVDTVLQVGFLAAFLGIAWWHNRARPRLREPVPIIPEPEHPADAPDARREIASGEASSPSPEEPSDQRRSQGTPPLV